MDSIINKVAESGLITIDLEELYTPGERVLFDLKGWLFEEQILREKDFREQLQRHDWQSYAGKFIAVTCTADAIVPTWAFMLVSAALTPFAARVFFGTVAELEDALFREQLSRLDVDSLRDQRVVIKGCSKVPVPTGAYVALTALLQPVVKSIFYGEPCSTVPVYKRK
ncbi:MAG: hypothetical protein RL213_959 [Bacteroidota bacterium]|jgi:hypothetical protein